MDQDIPNGLLKGNNYGIVSEEFSPEFRHKKDCSIKRESRNDVVRDPKSSAVQYHGKIRINSWSYRLGMAFKIGDAWNYI